MLRDGRAEFTPGLLARAHHGVLYIDEVNLLADHLVDVLLDAAAGGRVTIERDGVSHTQEADFVLVGTMNPEEGELRPQLLDRFGLAVDVAAGKDLDERVEVIRRRMAFDADPAGFAAAFADAEKELAQRIRAARAAVGEVSLPTRELRRIAGVCADLDVDGLRGDIVVARTAAAHAAWRGAAEVTEEDVRAAVELALPHRRRRNPFDESGLSADELDDAMRSGQEAAGPVPDDRGPDDPGPDDPGPDDPGPDYPDPATGRVANRPATDRNGHRRTPGALRPPGRPTATRPAATRPAATRSGHRPDPHSGPRAARVRSGCGPWR